MWPRLSGINGRVLLSFAGQSEFLKDGELTERRAFIESFVKEIVVMPDNALLRYTIPMPQDGPVGGKTAEQMALNGSVLSTVKMVGEGGLEPPRVLKPTGS